MFNISDVRLSVPLSVHLCVSATDPGTDTVSTVDSRKGGLTLGVDDQGMIKPHRNIKLVMTIHYYTTRI